MQVTYAQGMAHLSAGSLREPPMKRLLVPLALFLATGCERSQAPLPAVGPFADAAGTVAFGAPARTVARIPGVELNDDGQYVALRPSADWLYLFDTRIDAAPPHPDDRLVQIQVREEIRDTLELWHRWSEAVRRAEEVLGSPPRCIRLGGAQHRVTRAEFPGSPAMSVGAWIDVAEDGLAHEAYLILAARERYPVDEFETGFAHRRIDCDAAGGAPR